MDQLKNVSVFGLGKLGACIAATLADRGLNVVGVDVDPEKVSRINAGLAPVDEPRLGETIARAKGRLRATVDPAEAVATQATFFIPPSPSLPDGSFSNEYLLKAMQPLAAALARAGKKGHLFICSSTTTPGACDGVLIPMLERELGGVCGVDFHFCYNPEFIALGNVIQGLLEPDLVLIGESDPAAGAVLESLYRHYNTNQPRIARMAIVSAELTKISLNSYITMKISFTNQLRMIAETFPKADIRDILGAIGSDSRIGAKYLRPGLSYGGPCFPRDNRLVAYTARQAGLEAPLAEASDRVNESTKVRFAENILARTAEKDAILVLGMSYKPDTHLTEESAGLALAQHLQRNGRRVLVHDFASSPSNSPALHAFECLTTLDGLDRRDDIALAVICCPWPQYRDARVSPKTTLISPWVV